MLETVKKFFDANGKKLLWSLAAAVVAYVLLAFVIPGLLSVKVISLAGALAAGYLVYTKVALWEIQKLIDQGKAQIDSIQKKF